MRILARFALSIGAGAALLAGCALRQAQEGTPPPSGLSQSRTTATDAERGGSWMAPGAGNSDLLYIPNTSYVSVFRYRQRDLVGTLQGFDDIVAACSDSAGNVYFVDEASENIYEFAHGGTMAINTFQDSPYEPVGCSVNPLTGDLAVANTQTHPSGYGNIAIFPQGTGKPKFYTPPLHHYIGCAYDDQGNLLTTNGADINQGDSGFAWFAADARRLTRIRLRGSGLDGVGPIRWDGKYFVIFTSRSELTQVLVQNGHGKVVGVTKLAGHGIAGGYAIYLKQDAGQGTQVVGVYSSRSSFGAGEVEYWKYPAGGYVFATITGRSLMPTGVAISLKQ
jgi:hypothetical protein